MRGIRPYSSLRRQRGVSLFIVIVFVMMSMLLALWGARTSLFNEMIVGNDADYQRAYEASFARCYRTKAVGKAMAKRADDKDSKALVAKTLFHPERVKTND